MLRVTFMGTSSARPTVSRNTSALAVQHGGDLYLFDCGEGTQRQMMRYAVGFTVREIYITHMHADHYLGTVGLLRTMSLQDREEPLTLYAPPGDEELLRDWRLLHTSDHFYYMCVKYFSDGAVHKYFNPYDSPYDSYINFMNVLDNLRGRLRSRRGVRLQNQSA